ncbi:hypothetical protein [Paludisphaera soli]|uniref:hypothetical protein n=1 Tax=Paludisphaera soli TaxID=2712865 RepID=UPI0013EB2963|nr:hypothetical protein [Paludisphaera soli]
MAILNVAPGGGDVGPLVRALWLAQHYGTAEALRPENDRRLKAIVSKSLAGDGVVTLDKLGGFMDPKTFDDLAGPDAKLDAADIARGLADAEPESRAKLASSLREHADFLATTFDLIDDAHREAGEKLARWIAANYAPGKPLHVIVVCTGNSRRSILGSSMGNLAAAYYGMPEVRFHSGGTSPTAFNPRTVAALRAIGFDVEPTGAEAPKGDPKTDNPVHRVSWGRGFETLEFSKHYADPGNPQDGFAALMVCSEADEGCPFVRGASFRLSMPYLDPKIYDDGAYEAAKYAERRDDIGRLMLSVLMQARGAMRSKESSAP